MHSAVRGFLFIFVVTWFIIGIHLVYVPFPNTVIESNDTFLKSLVGNDDQDLQRWNADDNKVISAGDGYNISFQYLRSSSNGSSGVRRASSSSSIAGLPEYVNITFDTTRRSRVLWPKDPRCSRYKVYFSKNLTGTWLLSFPRSGNTWTRYLIEASTGVFTGSIYSSKFLTRLGYLGETDPPLSKATIVTKTHKVELISHDPGIPVLLLIRNPARSIVSYYNYQQTTEVDKKFTRTIAEKHYKSTNFRRYVKNRLGKWKDDIMYALQKNVSRLHIVFYEHLRDNPLREVLGIMRFLKVKPDMDRLFCLDRHLEGPAKGAQREIDPYTPEEKKEFAESILEVNSLMTARGFSVLPDYSKYNN